MPDIFVPADTTYYSEFYIQLARRGIVNACSSMIFWIQKGMSCPIVTILLKRF